ncbi:MAG: hypothetical protein U1F15_07490 [Burkholderiales bacterium]
MGIGWRCIVATSALVGSMSVGASALTVGECFEGSDFITNAARARENGMTRAAFLERMEEDLMLIQAYPPQLRWFAKDEDDERFLLEAARDVFDAPDAPEGHRARFLSACFARSTI